MTEGKQIYYHTLRENIRKMNPKFKEIAIQAGAYPDGDTVLTGPMDIAKFAELIVRECKKAIDPTGDLTSISEAGWRKACMKMIDEHFGVEE